MASQYKYKNDEELLQLIPNAPGGKLFSDEEEVFTAAGSTPFDARLGAWLGRRGFSESVIRHALEASWRRATEDTR